MITLTAEEAFLAYEAVRDRLPSASSAITTSKHATSLNDIAEQFDVFLLDAFGVLNIGDSPIPGTRERIDQLRQAGKRVLVVSNAASVPRTQLAEKYRRLGYSFAVEDIVTSRDTMATSLATGRNLSWGVMATEATGLDDMSGLRATFLGDDRASYDGVDGFLLIGSAAWTAARQKLLEASLIDNPRPVLVANPDIVAPREAGLSAEPGYFAHRLADRSGITPQFFGKPFSGIFEAAYRQLGGIHDKSRIVMVGDSLHTDILGAHAAGIASALVVEYGFLAGQDAEKAIRKTGIIPDFILKRP